MRYKIFKKISQYLLCFFLLVPLFSLAQDNTKIDTLIKIYKIAQHDNEIKIYSLQINSHESLETIELSQKKYTQIFQNTVSEIIFEAPEYKLITGVFMDKKDAEKQLQKVKKQFKNSFIFKQAITMSKFKESVKLID